MTIATAPDLAERIVATLRAHETALRGAGIRRLSLFGSAARGDAGPDSDIDLAAEFDPTAQMDMIRLAALERRLGETLGRPVEILPEPAENPLLRANLERDRLVAF
ncbi:MAG: nucleotidyltransferase domain-containing protein [Proteobacteria bacterium]|nr:nucleotidyltransferase domain-containing protein [Pseudomonadota bacterium]